MTRQSFRFTFFLLICLSIPLTATAQTVNIPDPNLRAAIEAELGKASGDTITADEMATLTEIEVENVDIRVLNGLERATNLTRLFLFNVSISDLSPLAGLTNLTTLDLVGGSISDLSPLAGLTQLTTLELVGHSISDLSPLAGLTNLTFLSLIYSPISDLSPLAGLTQLTTLYLYNNSISDISPLAGLTQLTLLLLDNNSISDISPLVTNTGLGNFDRVDVSGNPLSDASINTHIPALQRRGVNVEFDAIVVQPEDMAQMGDIPDPDLRAAIEAELGKASGDTITADEMATLTQIEAENANISNLTGLERATNLTTLVLSGYSISDISPLAGLTQLTTLELSSGSISDISPLAGLTNLTTLELSSSVISDLSDISPLAGLTQLTILWLNNHSISDISPLAALTNLTWLRLGNNSISDISPLAGLTNLTRLDLGRTNISDLSPLTGLTNLTRLDLSKTFISDISPLVANTGLGKGDQIDVSENPLSDASINTHIPALQSKGVTVVFNGMIFQPGDIVVDIPDPNLRAAVEDILLGVASGDPITADDMEALRILLAPNANISDLTGLEYATNLRELNLGAEEAEGRFINSNSISDLSPLAGLTRLTKLGLGNNSISDISPLAGLTQLRFLGLWENSISDISPLTGLTQLTDLRLRTNNITNLSPLAGLTNLTWLDLGNNSISDISLLEGLTRLTTLNLEINSISDISHLEGLTKLTTLDLETNSISDISPLAGLTYLSQLGLSANSISDISPLAGLTRLRFLGLGTNNITDISPLVDIFFLRILGLGANNITDISPVAQLTQLTDLNLENNSISDLLPLARLNKLTFLDLDSNSISDISPLVANTGLGNGDTVYLSVNPLNSASINTHIPALQTRGVTVGFDDIVALPADVRGPSVTKMSNVTDGEEADLEVLNRDGIIIEFDENIASSSLKLTLEDGTDLGWESTVKDNSVILTPFAGKELVHETSYVVSGMVRDGAGNETDLTLTFVAVKSPGTTDNEPTPTTDSRQAFESSTPSGYTRVTLSNSGTVWGVPAKYTTDSNVGKVAYMLLAKVKECEFATAELARQSKVYIKTQSLGYLNNYQSETVCRISSSTWSSAWNGIQITHLRFFDESSSSNINEAIYNFSTGQYELRNDQEPNLNQQPVDVLIYTGSAWGMKPSDAKMEAEITKNLLQLEGIQVGITEDVEYVKEWMIQTTDDGAVNVLILYGVIPDTIYPHRNTQPNGSVAEKWIETLDGNTIMNQADYIGWSSQNDPYTIDTPPEEWPPKQPVDPGQNKGIALRHLMDNPYITIDFRTENIPMLVTNGGKSLTPSLVNFDSDRPLPLDQLRGAWYAEKVFASDTGNTNAKLADPVIVRDGNRGRLAIVHQTHWEDNPKGNVAAEIIINYLLAEPERLPEDVNSDGIVNIQDLVLVASNLGKTGQNAADVNGDGVVNIQDLVLVAAALGSSAAAPPLNSESLSILTAEDVKGWLTQARQLNLTDTTSQRGILFLDQLLAALTPQETTLLANYPNPFNPETWIPYHLAKDANVTLHIYAVNGTLVRTLSLGHQASGMYQNRSRAAYWDGKNEFGEPVASGVYFYTLTAGDFSATRKMLIRK